MAFITDFEFNLVSFLLGFFAATLLYWLVSRLRKWYPAIRSFFISQVKKIHDKNLVNVDVILRQDVILRAQKSHLLQALCSLDEILVQPRLLVPPETLDFEAHSIHKTLTESVIAFFPECPEITSQYSYPSIPLTNAIQKNANLALYGQMGSGKTTALANLACLLARKDPSTGLKSDCFPLYLHVSDFNPITPENTEPFTHLVNTIAAWYPLIIRGRIPTFLRDRLNRHQLILILDGLDELATESLKKYVEFLESLLKNHPTLQIITACSSLNFDGLLKLGFIPMPLASWSSAERDEFIAKWEALWNNHIATNLPGKYPTDIDTNVLSSLLEQNNFSLTPLEWTLRVWSLYTGDIQDNRNISAIEAFIRRSSPDLTYLDKLQWLAFQMLQQQTTFLDRNSTDRLAFSPLSKDPSSQVKEQGNIIPQKGKASNLKSGVLDELTATGLLSLTRSGQIMFAHPLLISYLGSGYRGEVISEDEILPGDPDWSIFECYQHYQAAQSRMVEYIEDRLFQTESPLYLDLFRIARWLKDAPAQVPWRSQMMRLLVQLIHRDDLPFNLRSAFLSAFICSNDAGVFLLLRQTLSSASPQVRQLAALGCGALKDEKSLNGLLNLLADEFPDVQTTAILAIGAMRSSASFKVCEELLQSGDERISQAASEVLASIPGQGYAVLKEAAESEHILVRRAAVIGLGLISEEWSRQIIEKLAVQDSQWVVRNIAGQILENSRKTDTRVPSPLVEEHNCPWLLAFAAKKDQGIPVGKSPVGILIDALQTGTVDEKLAALGYLRKYCKDENLRNVIENATQSDNAEISQAAFNTLWIFSRCS